MIDRLIQLVIAVVVVGLLAWFLSWAMSALGVPAMFQTVVWILFALLVILALVGFLGYGPLKGNWRNP
jgi:hypothetical protein